MIKCVINNELGIFSSWHKYDFSKEPNPAYVTWALSIRNPIDTSSACSYQDEQTDRATLRPCS